MTGQDRRHINSMSVITHFLCCSALTTNQDFTENSRNLIIGIYNVMKKLNKITIQIRSSEIFIQRILILYLFFSEIKKIY